MASTNVHMWNATLERQLGSSWLASAGYVGSRTNNLWESTPLNNAVPGTAALNSRRPLFRQDPINGAFYGPLDLYVTDGTQSYKAMLLSIRGSGRYGTTVNANYALSRCFGSPDGGGGGTTNVSTGYNIPSDPHFDDGYCGSDRRHNFSMSASIQSPRFNNVGLRTALSDWRLVGSFRALTGPWLTVTTGGVDVAQNGQTGTQRANTVAGVDPYADQSTNPVNGFIRYLNPDAFAQPATGTMGNSVRNSVRGPGTKNIDLAVSRQFKVGNQQNIEFRLEAFNALNWFQLGNPALGRNSTATFGLISSVVNGSPRALQFAAKYAF
jgi:hypothetical protein